MPRTFRAGGEVRGVPAFTSSKVLLADISEFQPDISDTVYLAWSKAIVIRAMYGLTHDDAAWKNGARRDGLHRGGARFLGIYQYLVAGEDAADQAHALVRLIGHLRPGEKLIADLEEGDGNQLARWQQWRAVILAAYGAADPWLYSGLDYAGAHGLEPQWLAAYQAAEPVKPHLLWQFSDSYPVPGVGLADCSVFHGSIGQLAAYGWAPPQPPPSEEDPMAYVLDSLITGTAVCLPVPAGRTKVRVFADPGFDGHLQPRIRIGTAPKWNGGVIVEPKWSEPAIADLPKDTAEVTIGRVDTGDTAVTIDFA